MTNVFAPTDSRARIADWVELNALLSASAKITNAHVVRAINVIDDPVRDDEDEDRLGDVEDDDDLLGDRGILNTVDENLSLRVYEELEYRSSVLGANYPFELVVTGQNWSLTPRKRDFHSADGFAHLFYSVALLITAVKYEYIKLPKDHALLSDIPELMQAMAVLVAAEYMGGQAYWMGWPRPHEEKKFLAALGDFITRIGVGRLTSSNPSYDPNVVKDGSVDLIAWRSFNDRKPGKSVLYGQVASGRNWRSKPLQGTMDPHFVGWFQNGPTRERLLSMFIPYMQHEDCKPRRNQVYEELLMASAEKDEREFGIIFDRLRIAELASSALLNVIARSKETGVDFVDYVKQIARWKDDVIAAAS